MKKEKTGRNMKAEKKRNNNNRKFKIELGSDC